MLLPADCRDSSKQIFVQNSFNMKVTKKKVSIQSPLVNPIIDLERLLEKELKTGLYIAFKCHNTPGYNNSRSYEITLASLTMEEEHLKSGLSGKTKYSRPQKAKVSVCDLKGTPLLITY